MKKRYLILSLLLLILSIPSILYSQNEKHRIIAQIGGKNQSFDRIHSAIMDANEDMIVTGIFSKSAFVKDSTNPLTTPNQDDVFVIKLNKEGEPIWQKAFGGTGTEGIRSIATDNNGNIYITGFFTADFELEGEMLRATIPFTPFLIKLDKDGAKAWVKTFTFDGNAALPYVKADEAGNIYVTGILGGSSITIEGTTLSSNERNTFIIKYNTEGVLQWAKLMHNSNSAFISALAVAPDGIIIGGGIGKGILTYDGSPLNRDTGLVGVFYAKLNRDGALQWIKYNASGLNSAVTRINFGPDNTVILGGYFNDSLSLQNTKYTVKGDRNWDQDNFIIKISYQGEIGWHKVFGTDVADYFRDILIDKQNNIIVAGSYKGKLDLQDTTLNSIGTDIYVIKYDNTGKYLESHSSQGTHAAYSSAIAASLMMDNAQNLYVAGYINYETQFGDTTLKTRNADDGFIWKIENGISGITATEKPNLQVSVFPNPATNRLFLTFQNQSPLAPISVQIVSMEGRLLFNQPLTHQLQREGINIDRFPIGLYFLNILSNSGQQTTKFVKQ